MKTHPLAEIFPMMEDEDIFDLQTDIEQNGLLHPIITHDGMILDGRHRLMACRAAGVEPRFEEVSCDPLSLVLSANLHRRQLTSRDRKSTRLNSSHVSESRMPSSA